MTKTITLEGGKVVKLAANAATPFRFKQLFGQDLLKLFKKAEDEEEQPILGEVITQMAFIMNRQAEGVNLNSVSMDDFYSWLEEYDAMDFVLAGEEIINFYLGSSKPTIEAKKK